MKKTPGDIILNMSTIHENHMMYDSWDMEHDRQNFFSFWAIFCPFTPLSLHPNNPDNQNVEKAPGDIIILNKCTINDNHKIYGSWDIKCTRQNVFVILGHYLPYYPFNSLKNENFKKMKKKNKWRYHHFTYVYQKSWSYAILFLRYGMWQM